MSEQKELILRVEAKKKEFQAELASIENDIADGVKKKKKNLEGKIEEITNQLKNAENGLTETIAKKFNEWLH